MSYELFLKHLTGFVNDLANRIGYDQMNPFRLREMENLLKVYLTDPRLIELFGFDPYFHLRIKLQANPREQKLRINLSPLTPIGVDFCISCKIPMDEALLNKIRKSYNESFTEEILSRERQAYQLERSVRDDAGEGQERVLEEQGLEEKNFSSLGVSVPDSGYDGVSGPEVRREVPDTSSTSDGRDSSDNGVLHPSSGVESN